MELHPVGLLCASRDLGKKHMLRDFGNRPDLFSLIILVSPPGRRAAGTFQNAHFLPPFSACIRKLATLYPKCIRHSPVQRIYWGLQQCHQNPQTSRLQFQKLQHLQGQDSTCLMCSPLHLTKNPILYTKKRPDIETTSEHQWLPR